MKTKKRTPHREKHVEVAKIIWQTYGATQAAEIATILLKRADLLPRKKGEDLPF